MRQLFSGSHFSHESVVNIGLLLNDGVLSTILDDHQRAAAHVMEALWAELVSLSEQKPLVIMIDDIQYVDASSMECILYFARRLRPPSIAMVLATIRHPWRENSSLEAELGFLAHPHTVRLRPLSQHGVARIVSEYSDARTAEALAVAVYRASGGNPRLAMALAEDYRECFWKTGGELTPGDEFARAVQSCLSRCDPEVLRCAQAMGVLEEPTHPALLGRMLGLPEDMAADLLTGLIEAGLVSANRFRHPAIRMAVMSTMLPQDRADLHMRAARALHRENATARSIAGHLIAAGPAVVLSAETWVAGVLREAAEQAVGECDLNLAIQCLHLAAQLCDTESDHEVVAAWIAAAQWRVDPAVVVRQLSRLGRAVRDGHLRGPRAARVIYYQLWSGMPDEAIATLTDASRGESEASADAELLAVRLWGSHLYPGIAARLAPRLAEIPLHLASQQSQAVMLLASGDEFADLSLTNPGTAGLALDAGTLDDTTLGFIATAMAMSLYAGRSKGMELWSAEFLDAALLARSPMRRSRTWRGLCAAIFAAINFRLGDLPEAERQAREAITQLSPRSWGVLIGAPVAVLMLAATERGRLGDAGECLAIPVPDAMFQTSFGPLYLFARARYHQAAGKLRFALRDLEICGQLLGQWDMERPGFIPWRAVAAATHLRMGAEVEASKLLAWDPGPRRDREHGLWLRTRAAASPPREALLLLEEAIAVFRECGDRVETARSYADLSAVHEARGERGEAKRMRRKATQLARQCGIETIRRTNAGPDMSTIARADEASELSEAKRRVVALATHGYTNQEIASKLNITVSTVEQHLTHVYRKLKVNRRSDLPQLPLAAESGTNGSSASTLSRPGLWRPEVLAKVITAADLLSGGRQRCQRTLVPCQNSARGLAWCFTLGARARSPHLPVHGPVVRLAGAAGPQ
jgi:DNA-binding CsgD family transcriptional regulator